MAKARRRRKASQKKVVVSLKCTGDERKFMRMFAEKESRTLAEFVMHCVRKQMGKDSPHISSKNRKSGQKEDLIYFDAIDELFENLDETS